MKLNRSTKTTFAAAIGFAVLAGLAYAGTKPVADAHPSSSAWGPMTYKGQKFLAFTDGDGVPIYFSTTPSKLDTEIRKAEQPPLHIHAAPNIAYHQGQSVAMTVVNASDKPITIVQAEKSDDAYAAFRQTGNTCGTLAPKGVCVVRYDYLAPYTKGIGQYAYVTFYDNDGNIVGAGMLLGYIQGGAK